MLQPKPHLGSAMSATLQEQHRQQLAALRHLQQQQQQQQVHGRKQLGSDSPLESIATAAVNLLTGDGDEKAARLKKRRLQIAAASRKSRAKRKKELTVLKEENEKLWTEVVSLKKRLRELGDNVNISISDAASTSGGGSVLNGSADATTSRLQQRSMHNGEREAAPSVVPTNGSALIDALTQSGAKTNAVRVGMLGVAGSGSGSGSSSEGKTGSFQGQKKMDSIWSVDTSKLDPMWKNDEALSKMAGFFNDRLSWYFTQLKSDVLSRFASNLPYTCKQRVANLEVKLFPSNTGAAQIKLEDSASLASDN